MFTTDSRSERFLDSVGTSWLYANDIVFGQLSPTWKQENLGRSQSRVDRAVAEYASLMERGSAAPAPILWKNLRNDYEILDGYQRVAAAESRNTTMFSAYVVKTTSEQLARRIRVFANYRLQGGYQESSEWTLEHAIMLLVHTGQMSAEECAEFGGWSTTQVRDKHQVVECRLSIVGVGGPERLPDSITRLIAKNASRSDFEAGAPAIGRFTNAIQRMRFSAEEAEPHIEEFFAVSRSKGKLFDQFETKWREFENEDGIAARLADPGRTRYQPMTSDGRVLKALRAALTTTERALVTGEPITDMEEFFHVVNQIRAALQKIERMSKGRK